MQSNVCETLATACSSSCLRPVPAIGAVWRPRPTVTRLAALLLRRAPFSRGRDKTAPPGKKPPRSPENGFRCRFVRCALEFVAWPLSCLGRSSVRAAAFSSRPACAACSPARVAIFLAFPCSRRPSSSECANAPPLCPRFSLRGVPSFPRFPSPRGSCALRLHSPRHAFPPPCARSASRPRTPRKPRAVRSLSVGYCGSFRLPRGRHSADAVVLYRLAAVSSAGGRAPPRERATLFPSRSAWLFSGVLRGRGLDRREISALSGNILRVVVDIDP